jgi:ATP-dependent RNA helicase HelY
MPSSRDKGGRRRSRPGNNKGGRRPDGKNTRPLPAETRRPIVVSPEENKELQRLLEGIGPALLTPFKPDAFQVEALAALEHEDVLVTAPTGSGKTWIAREEIRRLLYNDGRAWYTSPLKALTNSKYEEFTAEFGAERVGILTGDRKENPEAPLIVGTTEIYRNQLFDSLRSGTRIAADLVVLDEAHYLADPDRGHVWEEAIILSPPRIRLLLLSATIGNAVEFARWIEEVREVRCGIVSRPGARPVPLRAAFLYPDGRLAPLVDQAGALNPEIARLAQPDRQDRRRPYSPFPRPKRR